MRRRQVLSLVLSLPFLNESPRAEGQLTFALYGFSSNKAPFNEFKIKDIAPWLKDHDVNAVFVYPDESEELLRQLKSAGLSLYQSMGVFVGRSDYLKRPEWRPVGVDGEALKPNEWYYPLSPNHPELRQRRLERFQQRLNNPHIDGIWLDFIRFPLRWENGAPNFEQACFSKHSLRAFETFSSIDIPKGATQEKAEWILSTHLDQWTAFKVESIRSWANQAANLRNAERPDVKLGFFGLPYSPDEHDGALRRIVGQDYTILANVVDIISPMIYHRMINKPVDRIRELTLEIQNVTDTPVWPVVQTMNLPDTLSGDEFQHAIVSAARASKQGLILFAANHIESENRWPQVKSALSVAKYPPKQL